MACEKCWSDAFGMMMSGEFESQSAAYQHLMNVRVDEKQCTPDERCGVGTTEMHTIHSHENQCACGLKQRQLSEE